MGWASRDEAQLFLFIYEFSIDDVGIRDYSYKRCYGKRLFQKNNL